MIPRASELLLILLAVGLILTFYRLPAIGDALGRLLFKKKTKSSARGDRGRSE